MPQDGDRSSRVAAARAMWSAGYYPAIAEVLAPAARHLAVAAGAAAGQRVLDVGAGSGSVAVAAAARGATVSAVDITDAWYPGGAAAGAGDITWSLADAAALPFRDDAFDRVLSSFAMIFSPQPRAVAREVVRVCRPGGVVAFTAWDPDAPAGRAFAALGRHLATGDSEPPPATTWGRRGDILARFGSDRVGHRVAWTFERASIRSEHASADAYERFALTNSGPMIAAREALEAAGTWPAALADLRAAIVAARVGTGPGFTIDMPYLLAVGRLAAA